MKKMMKNNSLTEIREALVAADSVLIFPHIFMDGDTFGSSVALCLALREKGKTAFVLIEDPIPGYLKFLEDGLCTYDIDIIKEPDLCVAIDSSDPERFVKRREKFFAGKKTLNIDHHKTSKLFADYNYVDPGAAATGEIIYDLLIEMGMAPDKKQYEAIYAAIVTDTGSFQYTNTTMKSHQVTVELLRHGIDSGFVNRMLYQNTRLQKLNVSGRILGTIKTFAGGEAVIAYLTKEMLSEAEALMEDAEGVTEILRSISGVELAIFAKEFKADKTRISMRSKSWADTAELSLKYGGGGHSRAGGCTINEPIFTAIEMIEADVTEYFEKNQKK